jgi:FMN-dependent NADH-azoreductase
MKLLHVDSSVLGPGSVSRDLSAEVVATFRGRHPGLAVTRLDLAATPIGHLTAAHLTAAQGAPVDDALKSDVAMGRGALEEFLASSRGGVYSEGSPAAFFDHQETYLKAAFGLLGITDITFIRAEGVAIGPEARGAALAAAKKETAALAA